MKELIAPESGIVTAKQYENVKLAAQMMKERKVGCLIVVNEHDEFVGLITERDLSNWVANTQTSAEEAQIQDIMTDHVVSCDPGTPTSQVREIMTTRGIRHLPIVDKGVMVGILSVRDLMGQQLAEDRAAAHEVAMLSNCLKSIEPEEAANIVSQEVPKLFDANKCVLCLYRNGQTDSTPELEAQNQCLRCQDMLSEVLDKRELQDQDVLYTDQVPKDCQDLGACGPRLLIPINVAGVQATADSEAAPLDGYLCMCGIDSEGTTNEELISYKAKLAKEILTSHLTNATLYRQARLTSLTDALTGIGSRKMLEDNLEIEYQRAIRYQDVFSVALIDLDNFKTINDVLGHATGDSALKRLAECMKKQKRTADVLTRYGGDEFVIVMPQTNADEAAVLLERFRQEVHNIVLAPDMHVTISCGVAECLLDRDTSPGDLMRRADLALYESKSAGRDCVRVWEKTMTKLISTNDIEIGKIKQLQRRVAGLSEKAEKMFMHSIWGVVQTLEAKNIYAQHHSENVMLYAMGLCQALDVGPKHTDIIKRAAMLHDIGKIGIPDEILSKPGKLTPRERKTIEQHPLIAVRILEKMNFLESEIEIVRHHHEKWNGQGYPDGLSKKAIPLGARILVLADSLDALTSDRPYRQARSLADSMSILIDSSGYEFDPEVAKGLVCWIEQLSHELGVPADQITTEDLLNSQRCQDPTIEELLMTEVAALVQ